MFKKCEFKKKENYRNVRNFFRVDCRNCVALTQQEDTETFLGRSFQILFQRIGEKFVVIVCNRQFLSSPLQWRVCCENSTIWLNCTKIFTYTAHVWSGPRQKHHQKPLKCLHSWVYPSNFWFLFRSRDELNNTQIWLLLW